MLKIVTFVLLCSTLLSVLSVPVTNTWQLAGNLKKGEPVQHSIAFGETFYFQGKVDITLNSHTDEKLVICIQEGTPLPNYERYSTPNACKYKLNFDAAPVVTTTTTGHSTTGTHTTTGHSTTGHSTTGHSTTGTHTTTGHSTTGHSTTGTHTTTGHSTTGHSTTGTHTTTGHSTTGTHTTTGHSTTSGSTTGTHTTTGHATTSGSTTGHASTTGSTTGPSLKKTLKKSGHGSSVNYVRYASTQSVDLRAGPHFFGVYYDSSSTTTRPQTVSFNITATYCDNGYGPECKQIQKLSDVLDKNVTISENVYYTYEVKASEPGTTLQDIHITFNKNDTLGVLSRFRGIPTATLNDGAGSNELKLVDPAIGTWVFEFTFNSTGGVHVYFITSLKTTLCTNGTGGENCAATLTNSTTLTSKSDLNVKLAKTNDIKYYAIFNTSFNGLYVSISDTSAKDKAVIYASFNRVPQPKNGTFDADIYGCNGAYCTAVQSISSRTNLTADPVTGVWYVAVVAARDNTEFNFWYDTICPRDCGGQGTCGTNADNYGVCACNPNFAGPICSPSNPLIEYIILIVIAALVLVSAILGLIAWAYMRRRAQYVEVK